MLIKIKHPTISTTIVQRTCHSPADFPPILEECLRIVWYRCPATGDPADFGISPAELHNFVHKVSPLPMLTALKLIDYMRVKVQFISRNY